MDALILARLQFAITTVYHFFFVPLTLGLSVLVAVMETQYVRSGKLADKQMTQFWGKLFLINFAMGIVTGIVQEFQFGMNWSEYSRFVGDIFGAPLAIEALLAFFVESTFLGVWFFGWEKLSKPIHLASIWLVALGSTFSAFWILIANSFMQQPVGYVLRNGRAEMTDFFALLTNPTIWTQFPHVFFSGVATASFFMLGISAWHLARQRNVEIFRHSFQLAALASLIGITLVVLIGHSQVQHIVRTQPMKIAAAEGLYQSANPASFSLITIGSLDGRSEVFSIRVPALLSLLAFNQFTGEVKGLNNLQAEYTARYGVGDYLPPVPWIYWSFRAMVGAGTVMGLLALFCVYLAMRNKIETRARWIKWLPYAILLPYLANSAGWLMTEMGRQPWIVFGLMRTEQGVSRVVAGGAVLFSLIVFTLVYGALIVVDFYLLRKFAQTDPVRIAESVGAY
ncbi:cytochrome bd ubiquinol oxidase subunit I [Anaerolineae bacterium]|nr:cytochrome bd ubiquinol oxidase subunit I [Anaerolineae bacterium]